MGLEFSAMHMVIDDELPSAAELKNIFDGPEHKHFKDDAHYQISMENLNDDLFWFFAEYGKPLPYIPEVFNTSTEAVEKNPRQAYQIERNKHFFALYCINSRTLFVSSVKKRKWLAKYLARKIDKKVVIKRFLKSPEYFTDQIKKVKQVKFVTKHNLFTGRQGSGNIFDSENDLFGLGVPESYTLEAKFDRVNLTEKFVEKFSELFSKADSSIDESLVCIGLDDKDFETVFNAGKFTRKINVDVETDEQDVYDSSEVRQALIDKIPNFNAN